MSFDPAALFSPDFHRDPYPIYEKLRSGAPVVKLGDFGSWATARYDVVRDGLRRPEALRSGLSDDYLATGGAEERWAERSPTTWSFWTNNLLAKNGPDHARLRRLVSRAFTPRVVRELRPRTEAIVEGLLDEIAPRGDMDLVTDFAYPLPITVIAELLGLPAERLHDLRRWSQPLTQILDGMTRGQKLDEAERAAREMHAYLREQLEIRRRNPGDSLLDGLLAAHEAGDRLSDDELMSICTLIVVAGHETTTNLVGNGLLALMRHRDQWDRLCAEPGLVPTAVEELLRFDSPVQFTARRTVGEIELGGQVIPDDQEVLLVLGGANRDPARFPDPDRLDLAREPNDHVSFSLGAHFCLGASLARMEAQVAFEALARRLPGLELACDPDGLSYRAGFVIRALEKLPVHW